MKVRILLFGATADVVGERELELTFPGDATTAGVFEKVLQDYPGLSEHSLLFALNQEYVNEAAELSDGDELAIFTAVSGG